jgi:hypothetical protein
MAVRIYLRICCAKAARFLTVCTTPLCVWQVLLQTSQGDIIIDLHVDLAPKTCKNFIKLCKCAMGRTHATLRWAIDNECDCVLMQFLATESSTTTTSSFTTSSRTS